MRPKKDKPISTRMNKQQPARRTIGPLTRRASGLVKLPADAPLTDLITDALAEKYLKRK